MYVVYLFKEKRTENIIYVGSSARPAERLKEHQQALDGKKPQSLVHKYMNENNLKLYRDVEVIFCDNGKDKDEMIKLEEEYYYKYLSPNLKNERAGENRHGWYNPKRRSVRCLNDNHEFKTVLECSYFYGIRRQNIHKVLSGLQNCTYKNGIAYKFEYVEYKSRKV
jgi:predicted GIY-YIG superfamily endonuclease